MYKAFLIDQSGDMTLIGEISLSDKFNVVSEAFRLAFLHVNKKPNSGRFTLRLESDDQVLGYSSDSNKWMTREKDDTYLYEGHILSDEGYKQLFEDKYQAIMAATSQRLGNPVEIKDL